MNDIPKVQRIVAVLWPSFVVAGVATILFFAAFDPAAILEANGYEPVSRLSGYSVGFFLFWLTTASACVLTCYFQRPCEEPPGPHASA